MKLKIVKDKEGLPRRIQRLREAKGWNHADLARAVGVTTTAAIAWEKDVNASRPRRDAMGRIATAFGVTPRYLNTGRVPTGMPTAKKGMSPVERVLDDTKRQIAAILKVDPAMIDVNFSCAA